MRRSFLIPIFVLLIPSAAFSFPGSLPDSFHRLQEKAKRKSIGELIADLRADEVRGNAICALKELYARETPELIPALEEALESEDWQQRQLAAAVFYKLKWFAPERLKDYVASNRLCEVIVEGLRNDALPSLHQRGRCVPLNNAAEGVRFLLSYPQQGTEPLEAALDSSDGQQQFLAAYVLGATGRGGKLARITEIVIPHLRDDEIWGNACMTAYALYHLGKEVIPYLQSHASAGDAQVQSAVNLILHNLETPPTPGSNERNTLSWRLGDPCVEIDNPVWWWHRVNLQSQ